MKEVNPTSNPSGERKNLTIIDYYYVFSENKKKILLFVLIVALITTIVYFFILKLQFLSTGVVKTTSKSSGLSALLGGTGLPDLGEFGDMASGGGAMTQELALYENILTSRKCLEETIIKFNIMEEEDFKYMFDALKYFRENVMEVSKDKTAGTLAIGVYDTDPKKAKDIADFLIYQLNKINVELNVQNAKNNRVFIEERYKIVQEDLQKAEDSLRIYQDFYGVSPEVQIQAAVRGRIELEAQIKSEEVRLELLKKILSPNEPEISQEEQKIEELKKQLNEVTSSDYELSSLNLKGSPQVILNFLRLRRDVEIQNKILTTLVPILEQAKISENKETPTVLILDEPQVPDKKSKPKRLTMTLFFTTLAFIISYLYYFLRTFYFKNKYH